MNHADEPLFHAIVAAHADPDPRMARRFSPFSPAPHPRHVAALLAGAPDPRPGLQSAWVARLEQARYAVYPLRLAAALSTSIGAALRPLPMVRTRQTPVCCTPGCS